ncbi:MAG: hypothetical protein WB392_13385 [Methanotrichaceae archaeon]
MCTKLFAYLTLLLLISVSSADPSSITTGPYNITFDLSTPMNYSVEVMPPFENDTYTSYSVLVNVSSDTKADIYIFDMKEPEDATITTIAETYKAYTHDINNSSVEISQIDGKDGIIAQYVNPQNEQVLQGIYWLDSNKIDNSSLSEASTEVRLYATMPQNSAEDMAIAQSLVNTLHIEKIEGQAAETNQIAETNQTIEPNQTTEASQAVETVVPSFRPEPYLSVRDQNVEDNHGYAIIDEAFSDGPGWVVVYNENYVPYSRAISSPIGYTHVDDGLNRIVKVKLNMALVSDKLYAVLFKDEGQVGTFEYPGSDYPLDIHAETIYPFSSIWPHPLGDLQIDWREHTSEPGSIWI